MVFKKKGNERLLLAFSYEAGLNTYFFPFNLNG